jgi:hypothetical protein
LISTINSYYPDEIVKYYTPEGANQEVLNLGGNKEDNEDNEEQEMNEQIDKFEENLEQ